MSGCYDYGCGCEQLLIKCHCGESDRYDGRYLDELLESARRDGWKIIDENECYCAKCKSLKLKMAV